MGIYLCCCCGNFIDNDEYPGDECPIHEGELSCTNCVEKREINEEEKNEKSR
jgi:hypothetical protein